MRRDTPYCLGQLTVPGLCGRLRPADDRSWPRVRHSLVSPADQPGAPAVAWLAPIMASGTKKGEPQGGLGICLPLVGGWSSYTAAAWLLAAIAPALRRWREPGQRR